MLLYDDEPYGFALYVTNAPDAKRNLNGKAKSNRGAIFSTCGFVEFVWGNLAGLLDSCIINWKSGKLYIRFVNLTNIDVHVKQGTGLGFTNK